MTNELRTILGITYRVKSRQRFGYIIENIHNLNDIRRICLTGWEQAEIVK